MNWLNRQPFFIKLTNKEYWPIYVTYAPIFFYYLYLSFRAKSFFFFSATNPSIEAGGLFGESKKGILEKIDDKYKPASPLIPKGTPIDTILEILKANNIDFPIVLKPDIGSRGTLVEKLDNVEDLNRHISRNDVNYIVQPFIDYEEEFAIMFWRMPNEERPTITSVTLKKFLSFTGDGKSTLRELILAYPRSILQYDSLQKKYSEQMDIVLPKGNIIEAEPIGNHCRGTMFLDGNHLIDEDLENLIFEMTSNIEEVYFGRFDLKCKSVEDLKKGKNILVMELNGANSEPAHIYDPKSNFFDVYKTLFKQWRMIFDIAMYNHKVRNIPFMSIKEMWIYKKNLNKYYKTIQ
ncbi:MAG: hypothetical protein ACI97N_001858 [Cognaticolwellia sp.]|jgi:hypothetical protein